MIHVGLTGGMIAAAFAGFLFVSGGYGLCAFLAEFIAHFWEVNG